MNLRRALTGGLFGLVIAAAGPVSAASAAPPYPPETGGLTVSATVVTVGSTITVSGDGFAPNSPVNVSTAMANQGFAGSSPFGESGLGGFRSSNEAVQRLAAAAAVVLADAGGSFSAQVTLNEVGTVVITATGLSPSGATRTLSATVEVVGAGGAGAGADDGTGGTGTGDGGASGVGGDGGLADTGASLRVPVTLGAILVLGGAGLITAVRRRKRGDATAS